jgi:GTP-binding protein Era
MEDFKSGFVSIIGMPNAGKSTLYNALLGEKLAIINPKAQTTRHRILGIKNGEGYQVIFSDTPGILHKTSYKMHEKMMRFVNESLRDSDVLILLFDIKKPNLTEELVEKFKSSKAKKIVVLNKLDLSFQDEVTAVMNNLQKEFPADAYLSISAEYKFQIEVLEKMVLDYLPIHPPYFPEDQLTDRSERFFVNEIIRNNLLALYDEEIPYSCEVITLSFKETNKIIRLSCEIVVERDSQKPIILGKGGKKIKRLGIDSRKQLEEFFDKQVFLETFVKVREEWRNNDKMLNQFGYNND